jgi:hypothetical protein
MCFAENLGGEGLDCRAIFPGVQRQSRFPAGLVEESLAIPVVLDWHLRQKQAAMSSHADQQAVASDFDGLG